MRILKKSHIIFLTCAFVCISLYLLTNDNAKDMSVTNEDLIISSLNETLALVNKELIAMRNSLRATNVDPSLLSASPGTFQSIKSSVDVHKHAGASSALINEHLMPINGSAPARKQFVLFTMDSIESYEKNSLTGGAAGYSMTSM